MIKSFFLVVPNNCNSFSGPHSTECLNNLWIYGGCREGGNKFPGLSLINADEIRMKNLTWVFISIFEKLIAVWSYCIFISYLVRYISTKKELADKGIVPKQLECFGLGICIITIILLWTIHFYVTYIFLTAYEFILM